MSLERTSIDDRLGRKGYTMVARAPGIGLAQMEDGSWHVLAGSSPAEPTVIHEVDRGLIPFILSSGGDIVMYRLPDDGRGEAVPVLSRGGMAGRPPSLRSVLPHSPELVAGLDALRESRRPAAVKSRPGKARAIDRKAAAATAACLAVVLALGAWAGGALSPAPPPQGTWRPDMSNPREAAQAQGASLLLVERPGDPEMIDVYRVYPGKDGARDHVESFRREDYERSGGYIPESPVPWRKIGQSR